MPYDEFSVNYPVDLTMIRWFLTLTPAQRLQFADNHIHSIMRIRQDNLRTLNSSDVWATKAEKKPGYTPQQ